MSEYLSIFVNISGMVAFPFLVSHRRNSIINPTLSAHRCGKKQKVYVLCFT